MQRKFAEHHEFLHLRRKGDRRDKPPIVLPHISTLFAQQSKAAYLSCTDDITEPVLV
jgi:hypothetical protein